MIASSSVRVLSSSLGSLIVTDTLSGLIRVVKVAPDVRHLVGFAILVSLCILFICLLVFRSPSRCSPRLRCRLRA